MFATRNLGVRLDLRKGVYITGVYGKTKSWSLKGGETESGGRIGPRWRAQGGVSAPPGTYPPSRLCFVQIFFLYFFIYQNNKFPEVSRYSEKVTYLKIT